MKISQEISDQVKAVVKKLGLKSVEFMVEHPEDLSHGDYACNVALMGFKQATDKFKSPRELANRIAQKLSETELKKVAKNIDVAGPGFINITIQNVPLGRHVDKVLSRNFKTKYKNKKVCVEYTDPNPFKEFHIGHLISNITGESIAKIFEANGAIVWRTDYYGDVGMHIAKSLWGMMKKMKDEKASLKELEKKSIKDRQKFMGEGYALGAKMFEKNKQVQEEMKDLNYLVYVAGQKTLQKMRGWKPVVDYQRFVKGKTDKLDEIIEVYEAGLKWSLDYFETYYQRLGTKFDGYYPESFVGELGMKLVEEGLKKKVLEKSQGAVVYKGEQDGLHTRVFVNKLGLPTYEAKELGLAPAKYQDFKYDQSIIVIGQEIDEYFKVLLTVLRKIKPELGNKTQHLPTGMVKVPGGTMSSRFGNVITVQWLLDEAKKRALKIMKDTNIKAKEDVAEMIGQAAVKYAMLKVKVGSDIVFDFDKSVSFEGNSGPYLQYTYARAKSVLRKAGEKSYKVRNLITFLKEERELLQILSRFDEVVVKAADELAPNVVANFLYELAQKFNSFYNKWPIKDDKKRLWLTLATAKELKKGLAMLGIKCPEKM